MRENRGKSRRPRPIRISWPEVNLTEAELKQYFEILLTPSVYLSQMPFLFWPSADDRARKAGSARSK
ncbi:MAG: hypothetical protein ONB23_09480 [candidate division KSB1 bacterium]|nr:hypothetical protein [candidate division KSB1 bacterium]